MVQLIRKISTKGYEMAVRARTNMQTARMLAPAAAGRVARPQSGATMVEYAILVALIAIAVIITVVAVGEQIESVFNDVLKYLKNAQNSSE